MAKKRPTQIPATTIDLVSSTAAMMPAQAAFQAVSAAEIVKEGLGFQRAHGMKGDTFTDSSTVVIVPTRGVINFRVIQSWQVLMAPMNQKRQWLYAVGDEVGIAYNNMIRLILGNPDLSKYKYILTLEDDNLQPSDAHIRLLESIAEHNFDAVSGIYWTKGDYNMPMAYGDPARYAATGVLDFEPRDVRAALAKGHVMEVNGIAMGCALWRMDMFREVPEPWFVTVSDVTPTGPQAFTQDLYFCKRARERGKRFAVDFRVPVGHLDITTGILY